MAYARPSLVARNPADMGPERSRPYWESQYHPYIPISERPPQHHRHLSNSNMADPDPMDPESSDSDVSAMGGDKYQYSSPPTAPASLPPPPSKHTLESSDAVQARLRDLSRVEDNNIKKHELLMAKRRRKDERIGRKRDIQDRKWRSIMDARARRDARVIARREREDIAYKRFDEQLEEEEMNLHRRLKRLKRGLPIDESPQIGARSISSTSMSPPGPTFSTVPPPAKRHQTGPPGQLDSINPGPYPSQSPSLLPPPPPPPPQYGSHPAPPPNGPPAPQYSFYQPNAPSYNMPYHPSQPPPPPPPPHHQYGPPASNQSPSAPPNGPPRLEHQPSDRSGYNMNGRPPSSPSRQSQPPPLPPNHNSPNSVNGPPRATTSTYDTRPPPSTTSSGFASINTPQGAGFASINAKGPPPPPFVKSDSDPSRTPSSGPVMDYGVGSHHRMYNYGGAPIGAPSPIPATGKRTPSTTHPYQMSEAFANRHHHCERVDGLNRGIWTSFGPMGTQDAPTGPPTEMYLRCDHDNCRRIDWRTVHGLQCHIVKNHDQPKGTIGSLEKALDKYGVPVKEVEDYEREHGEGTAGTMADPKNLKIKNKTKEAAIGRGNWKRNSPSPYGYDPTARPAGFKPDPVTTLDSPNMVPSTGRSPTSSVAAASGYMQDDIVTSDDEDDYHKSRAHAIRKPTTLYDTANTDWRTAVDQATPSKQELRTEYVPADTNQRSYEVSVPSHDKQNDQNVDHVAVDSEQLSSQKHVEDNTALPNQIPVTSINGTFGGNENQQKEQEEEKSQKFPSLDTEKPQENDTPMIGVAEAAQEVEPKEDEVAQKNKTIQEETDHLVNGDTLPIQETIKSEDQEDKTETADARPTGETDVPALPPPPPPSTSRRSTLQSPIMTSKIPSTPTSTKRGSRRSSTARKMSVDGVDVDIVAPTVTEKDTKDKQVEGDADKDSERAAAASTGTKTPPRRLPNGRLLRKGR